MFYPKLHSIPYQNPSDIFTLFAEQNGSILLDSAKLMSGCGRYSFIGLDPFLILQSKNNNVYCNEEKMTGNPFDVLQEKLAEFSLQYHPELPPFQGGAMGFFSYDLVHHLENISSSQQDDMQFPDMIVGFYDLVIAFDHELKQAWIFSSGYPLLKKEAREERAEQRWVALLKKLKNHEPFIREVSAFCKKEDIHSNFSEDSYIAAVKKVKDYILAGDIFEANISQRFSALLEKLSSFDLYQRLRNRNAAPFSAYLYFDEIAIASASPERFLKLTGKQVETRPIKGTRPRGKNIEEDKNYARELQNSEKDHAENIMIVDLLRNDLSRVCEDHSVNVLQLCGLESYETVHHLVSVVVGKLKAEADAVDLLRATFPGGSITGAPKIRAMEIIAEIEPMQRGPYCGSIGYIGFNGDMDTSIVIRTYAIKNNKVTFQAGGAIVVDSDPVAEFEETLVKASALQRALSE